MKTLEDLRQATPKHVGEGKDCHPAHLEQLGVDTVPCLNLYNGQKYVNTPKDKQKDVKSRPSCSYPAL